VRAGLFVIFLAFRFSLCAAEVTLRGRVVDENDAPVRDARVRVSPAWEGQTDPTGLFTITLSGPSDLLITIEHEGYYALKDHAVHVDASEELTFVINSVREVFQSENVNAQTSPVDVGGTPNEEHLSGTEVNDIPYANSHSLRNSLELLPGVVQISVARFIRTGPRKTKCSICSTISTLRIRFPGSSRLFFRWKAFDP
jgi:hypothetical protein